MMGETRQHALEDLVVGPLERQAAASLVGDGENAVDIGKIAAASAPSRNVSATYREVLAEQLTVLITAM